jgi:hypothetical protein
VVKHHEVRQRLHGEIWNYAITRTGLRWIAIKFVGFVSAIINQDTYAEMPFGYLTKRKTNLLGLERAHGLICPSLLRFAGASAGRLRGQPVGAG